MPNSGLYLRKQRIHLKDWGSISSRIYFRLGKWYEADLPHPHSHSHSHRPQLDRRLPHTPTCLKQTKAKVNISVSLRDCSHRSALTLPSPLAATSSTTSSTTATATVTA